jgi:hypothetical protein
MLAVPGRCSRCLQTGVDVVSTFHYTGGSEGGMRRKRKYSWFCERCWRSDPEDYQILSQEEFNAYLEEQQRTSQVLSKS